jgi:membrane dipeptidase
MGSRYALNQGGRAMSQPAGFMSQEASQLHEDAHIIDMHVDSFLLARQYGYDFLKRHRPLPFGALFRHADLPRMIEGGVDTIGFGVVTNPFTAPFNCWQNSLFQIQLFQNACERSEGLLAAARSSDHARELKAKGVRNGFLGLEGAHCLGNDLDHVEQAHKAGVRYITLTHFSSNNAASCARGKKASATRGLTPWGLELIERMNATGVMVDVAHVGRNSFLEAVARSAKPCIASHTGLTAVTPSWRNIDDGMMKALADKGGVACIIFTPQFISKHLRDSAEAIFRHIDHVVRTVGEDHVGLGSDFDGYVAPMPDNLRDMAAMPVITEIMLRRGYKESRIRKVLGENIMRVWAQNERPV